ncbi:MAG: CotS family spore coat protein [Lachnospiraceae bacterium]|nr:CotS family spore coat protein [Lachnospiraceae bacterium]
MNDRAISILENYDFVVTKTYKTRGAFVCETDRGLKILKEYQAPVSKLGLMDVLLQGVAKNSQVFVDTLVKDKEDKFISYDRDGMGYVVKDYYEGRECAPKEEADLKYAMRALALLHEGLMLPDATITEELHRYDLEEDVVRRNKGLKKIRAFIRTRGRKTEFELALLDAYTLFLNQAVRAEERIRSEDFTSFYESVERRKQFAHGDYQYHNILFGKEQAAIINFEKCQWDSRVRDVSLFLRKTLEKADWDIDLGCALLREYESVNPLNESEKRQLFYRLAYPEKFRKIANFYYNSNKAFLSNQYLSKLQNVLRLEQSKNRFLCKVFDDEI